jgi:hypothetical protein
MQQSANASSQKKPGARKRLLDTPTYPYAPVSELSTLFARLDIQAAGWVNFRHPKLQLLSGEEASSSMMTPPQSPTTMLSLPNFSNLQSAYSAQEQTLSDWLRDFQVATKDRTEAPSTEALIRLKTEYTNRTAQWNKAFEDLQARNAKKSQTASDHVNNLKAIKIMQIMHILMSMYLEIDHEAAATNETIWDNYHTQFRLIIEYAKVFLNPTSITHDAKKAKPHFTLEPGIIAPLMLVATRCRHPLIRREALELLVAWPRKEGVWDSHSAARRCQGWMEIEEAGIAIDGNLDTLEEGRKIPNWARVCGFAITANEDPELGEDMVMVEVFYVRQPPAGKENTFEGSFRRTIPW